jgi:hypothetical protein
VVDKTFELPLESSYSDCTGCLSMQGRAHGAFLCKLKEHFTARGTFLEAVDSNAESLFELSEASLEHANEALERKHQTSTRLLTPAELQSEDKSSGAADVYEVDSATSVIRT